MRRYATCQRAASSVSTPFSASAAMTVAMTSSTAADVSSSLQLSIYAIAMSRAFRQKVGALSYLVLTGPQKVSVQYDPSTEEKTLKVLRETGEKILDMDMNGRGDCARCPIRKTCPESKAKEDPKEN